MEETAFSIYVQLNLYRTTNVFQSRTKWTKRNACGGNAIHSGHVFRRGCCAPGVLESDLFLSTLKVYIYFTCTTLLIFCEFDTFFSTFSLFFLQTCCCARGFFFARCVNNDGGKRWNGTMRHRKRGIDRQSPRSEKIKFKKYTRRVKPQNWRKALAFTI